MDFWNSHAFPDWHAYAACEGMDQETFFGKEEQPGKKRHRPALTEAEAREAKRICFGCPVMEECRDWALSRQEEFGVWGGMTKRDRERYYKRNNIKINRRAASDIIDELIKSPVVGLDEGGWSE